MVLIREFLMQHLPDTFNFPKLTYECISIYGLTILMSLIVFALLVKKMYYLKLLTPTQIPSQPEVMKLKVETFSDHYFKELPFHFSSLRHISFDRKTIRRQEVIRQNRFSHFKQVQQNQLNRLRRKRNRSLEIFRNNNTPQPLPTSHSLGDILSNSASPEEPSLLMDATPPQERQIRSHRPSKMQRMKKYVVKRLRCCIKPQTTE